MNSSLAEDPVNRLFLSIAEDRLSGFHERPLEVLASRCELPTQEVRERLVSLLRGGIVRAVRQTLPSTSFTRSCLVAWHLPEDALESAFDWLVRHDPFSGHVVLREAEDPSSPGAEFRLWTTLRLPAPEGNLEEHCRILSRCIGAREFVCMPVVGMFRLSVGHLRRVGLPPGTVEDELPVIRRPKQLELDEEDRRVLLAFRAPLSEEELGLEEPWFLRAASLGLGKEDFYCRARRLAESGALGRFAVVLNHTDSAARAVAGTSEAALLMWAVPSGEEERAGAICARHVCMTHCYWRSGAEKNFGGVQIMGMVHGPTRSVVRDHKKAIDAALSRAGIPLLYSQMHWTLRARIRPSEFDPVAYAAWRHAVSGITGIQ